MADQHSPLANLSHPPLGKVCETGFHHTVLKALQVGDLGPSCYFPDVLLFGAFDHPGGECAKTTFGVAYLGPRKVKPLLRKS